MEGGNKYVPLDLLLLLPITDCFEGARLTLVAIASFGVGSLMTRGNMLAIFMRKTDNNML